MLSYCYMVEDYTLYEGIKRILPGQYLVADTNSLQVKTYYEIHNNEINISLDDAIEEVDRLFVRAVQLQAAKNDEYGFNHWSALSAGLDSRMTCWTLRRLGYDNVTAFTYSQVGEFDQIYPGKMASAMKYEWLFKSLDNGLDMFGIDESIQLADGIIYYSWVSQLSHFLKLVDCAKLGIVHTGVIGDVVPGTFYRHQFTRKEYTFGDGARSNILLPKLRKYYEPHKYEYERGMMLNRGIIGVHQAYSLPFLTCSEPSSPFMNLEFFNFCMSLPINMRIEHKLYYAWVLKKYPDAAKFPHNGQKIKQISGRKLCFTYHGKQVPFSRIPGKLLEVLGIRKGMNPSDYWYASNERLRNYLDAYMEANAHFISDDELRKDALMLYRQGSALEKSAPITLAGTLKFISESE